MVLISVHQRKSAVKKVLALIFLRVPPCPLGLLFLEGYCFSDSPSFACIRD